MNPRPGMAKTLGIMNIVFSVILAVWMVGTAFMAIAMAMSGQQAPVPVAAASGKQVTFSFSFMNDPVMTRFWIIDLATALPLNVIMFVTGLGLINLRRWGATWWSWASWAKIVRLVLVYGYFIIGVVPTMSAVIAKMVVSIFEAQKMPPGRAPTLPMLTMIYTYTYSIMGVMMILAGIIYPAVSIWLLTRPALKASLGSSPAKPQFFHDEEIVPS